MSDNLPGYVIRYLKKYSSDSWTLERNFRSISTAVVVPAINEYENLQKLLLSFIENNPAKYPEIAVIIVVNQTESADDATGMDNRRSLEFLRSVINKTPVNETAKSIIDSGLKIGLVDAASPGRYLSEKEGGVGLARKIGMDLAHTLFNYRGRKIPHVICTDADCTVSENYFSTISEIHNNNIPAGYVSFEHPLDAEHPEAIICYEIFLRYYVLGLRYAGSPYAFHTIGSTMFCNAESYCKIEGMNKRKAAEDFYFMEKLAKLVPITAVTGAVVYPSGRPSERVPFGTGQRVRRFLGGEKDEYLLYDPRSFEILKQWLKLFGKTAADGKEILKSAAEIHPALAGFLNEQNFEKDWNRILTNTKTKEQLMKQQQYWMDGFRTLKLIHYLRNNIYPDINMFDALDTMFNWMNIEPIKRGREELPELRVQKEYLLRLRDYEK